MATILSTQAAPLSPLTWNSPHMQKLLHKYWSNHDNDVLCHLAERAPSPFFQQFADFFEHRGFINTPGPARADILDNLTHPVFDKKNWVTSLNDMDTFFDQIQPALQLASKFLEHDTFLPWWCHLRNGKPGYEKGWVAVKKVPELTSAMIIDVRAELHKVAKRIHFTFLKDTDLRAQGMYARNLHWIFKILHRRVHGKKAKYWKLEFRNPWDLTLCPTIILPASVYFKAVTNGLGLWDQFNLACTLLHELAHACTSLWRPELNHHYEPLIQPTDDFGEAGWSLENELFGGHCSRNSARDPIQCADVAHSFPVDTEHTLGLRTFVPESYINRWFLKETWTRIPGIREQLYLPTISRQTKLFVVDRCIGGSICKEIYYKHAKLYPYLEDTSDWVSEVGFEVIEREILYAERQRLSKSLKSSQCGIENAQSSEYALESVEYTTFASTITKLIADFRKELKPIQWSSGSKSIASEYKKIWKQEFMGPMKDNPPHAYWSYTTLCCPLIHLGPDSELSLTPDADFKKRYYHGLGPCPYHQNTSVAYRTPSVPFSQRVESVGKLKRIHDKVSPTRCRLTPRLMDMDTTLEHEVGETRKVLMRKRAQRSTNLRAEKFLVILMRGWNLGSHCPYDEHKIQLGDILFKLGVLFY